MMIDRVNNVVVGDATGELYDPATDSSETFPMVHERNTHTTVVLPSGKPMVIGGYSGGTGYVTGIDGTAVQTCETFVMP